MQYRANFILKRLNFSIIINFPRQKPFHLDDTIYFFFFYWVCLKNNCKFLSVISLFCLADFFNLLSLEAIISQGSRRGHIKRRDLKESGRKRSRLTWWENFRSFFITSPTSYRKRNIVICTVVCINERTIKLG